MQNTAQWSPFLLALAQELDGQLDTDSIRTLMQRLGVRMAQTLPLAPTQTVEDLTEAMNRHWGTLGWGRIDLHDAGDALHLHHQDAPFDVLFGPGSAAWTDAILEGLYTAWLQAAGAPPSLSVQRIASPADAPDQHHLHFSLSARHG